MPTRCFIWGMAPNKQFIGKDCAGFGGIRWQLVGFRRIIAMQVQLLVEHIAWPTDWVPNFNGRWSFEQLRDNLLSLDSTAVQQLAARMPAGSLLATTLGPNEAFVCPGGWIVAETTQTSSARGVRRTLLQEMNDWLEFASQHEPPNVLTMTLADFVKKVLAQRAMAVPS